MQITYKFIQKVTAAITPITGSLLQINDTFLTVLQKLQGLLFERSLRSVLTSTNVSGASSTSWINVHSLTIPANSLKVGDVFKFSAGGTVDKPNSSGTNYNIGVGFGTPSTHSVTFTPTAALTAKDFFIQGYIVVRSIGASGEVIGQVNASCYTTATARLTQNSYAQISTIDTTGSLTIYYGIRFSNSNASNKVTTDICEIVKL